MPNRLKQRIHKSFSAVPDAPPTERALTHFFTLEFTRRTLLATSSKCKGVEGFTVTVPYLLQHYRIRA